MNAPAGIRSVSANGRRFHYWQSGEGDDVVMVHGVGANLAMWQFTIAADLQADHRLTMYDLRGHGRSDVPPTGYTSHDMVEDLHGILDTLELDQVSLIGHSFGADIVLHFALRHPHRVRRLVAIEAGLPTLFNVRRQPEWTGWGEWTHLLESEAGIRKEPRDWHRIYTQLRRGEELPDHELSPDHPLPPRGKRLVRLLTQTTMIRDYEAPSELTRERLPALTIPTLLVYGADSSYHPSLELLRKTLPHHTEVVVAKADHFTVLQRSIALPIRQFLELATPTT